MSKGFQKIAFFGGTFDPVHRGHIIMAMDVCRHMSLDAFYFVPAAQSPLKSTSPVASNQDRINMLELAVAGDPEFGVMDIECSSGQISYTYDTVVKLREKWSEATFYWVIGKDQLLNIHKWRRINDLAQLVEFICVDRPHYRDDFDQVPGTIRLHWVKEHLIDTSSTGIREALKVGKSIEGLVPEPVGDYIQKHNLYH